MVQENQTSIGSGSPLNFTQVLEKYKSLISVIAPYSEGGALRVELSDRIDSGDWKTLAYKGGLFTSNYRGKYTYYVKASNADETVAQLKALGITVPDVEYKGKGASSASPKTEAKPTTKSASKPTKKQVAQAKKLIKMVDSMKEMGITNPDQLKNLF
jgi:hypothetical protein